MFLASDVIKRHFGAHTESEESSSLPVAKHFLRLSHRNTSLVLRKLHGVPLRPCLYTSMYEPPFSILAYELFMHTRWH